MQKRSTYIATVLVLAAASAAAADMVVIANPSAGPLTREQVADIFLGKSQAMTPIDLPEGSPAYADFYRKATGRDIAQVKATWARLVFSGKAQAPRQVADAGAMKKAIAADPKGVGYIEKSAVDSSVKVLVSLD